MLPQFENTTNAYEYRSNKDLRLARFLFGSMSYPLITRIGSIATRLAIKAHLPVTKIIRKTIYRQFCGGENIEEAAATARLIGKYHVGVILDYGVEGKESEDEYNKATIEFITAITFAASQRNIPFVSLKVTGFARFGLLEKIHSGETLSQQEASEWQRVIDRIDRICTTAFQKKIMILIDAEETWIQEPTNILTEMMMEKFNRERALIFITYQLYSHGTLQFLKDTYDKAVQRGYVLGCKLVRGAYMEKERARALEKGYPDPIQPDKKSTDRDYDDAVIFCMQHLGKLSLFIGTHNESSCLEAVAYMQQHDISAGNPNVYFSQLYGMGDNISFNLAHEGYNVSKYLPYGPVKDVIPYLLRRAQENTSVAGQTNRELILINKEIKRRAA